MGKTLAELLVVARQIRDETVEGANTAVRVGQFFDDFLTGFDEITGRIWEFVLDGTYIDQPNALSIAAGQRTKITIDGLGGHNHSPNFAGHIWDTSSSKLRPIAADDFYHLRFAITGQSINQAVNRFEAEFDVNGSSGVIGRETGVFAKGAGNAQSFNFVSGFFAGGDFLANGGEIYITPLADAEFWELAVTIERTYTPIL